MPRIMGWILSRKMIWLLALSVFAFVFISNNLLSKGNALLAAERSFDKGDYVSSYGELTGVKLGELR